MKRRSLTKQKKTPHAGEHTAGKRDFAVFQRDLHVVCVAVLFEPAGAEKKARFPVFQINLRAFQTGEGRGTVVKFQSIPIRQRMLPVLGPVQPVLQDKQGCGAGPYILYACKVTAKVLDQRVKPSVLRPDAGILHGPGVRGIDELRLFVFHERTEGRVRRGRADYDRTAPGKRSLGRHGFVQHQEPSVPHFRHRGIAGHQRIEAARRDVDHGIGEAGPFPLRIIGVRRADPLPVPVLPELPTAVVHHEVQVYPASRHQGGGIVDHAPFLRRVPGVVEQRLYMAEPSLRRFGPREADPGIGDPRLKSLFLLPAGVDHIINAPKPEHGPAPDIVPLLREEVGPGHRPKSFSEIHPKPPMPFPYSCCLPLYHRFPVLCCP